MVAAWIDGVAGHLGVGTMDALPPVMASQKVSLGCPLVGATVAAGFPSPAEDYIERALDLNELLIAHPAATFFVRVTGDSMRELGIFHGDLLVVDRALPPRLGRVVIAVLDGQFTVKQLRRDAAGLFLQPANPDYPPIRVQEDEDFTIWGVATYCLHRI